MIARIKLYLAALGALVVAIAMAYLKGRADKSADARKDQLEMEVDAHERINDADTGGGATDSERIKRLREMASQLRD